MSTSSSKPPRLHVGTTTTSATATATTNGSADSPGSTSSSSRGPRPTPTAAAGAGGGGGIGSGQACAACRYQRRKCNPDCPLAPYFPADQPRRFVNAHRLFGVGNIQKTLRRIEPKYGPEAMRALIYESEARAADPVGGCVGIIEELRRQIRDTQMELHFVTQQIAICRQADGGQLSDDPAAAAMILPAAAASPVADDMVAAVDAIYAGQQPSIIPAGGSDGLVFRHRQQQDYNHVGGLKVEDEHNGPSSYQLYDYFCYNGTARDETTSDDGGMQQYGFAAGVVDTSVKAAALGDQLGQQCQIEALPFVDAFNVKPQGLPATVQHHGPAAAGDMLHQKQKNLVATPPSVLQVKHDDVDEHMEQQQATAPGAPCHLDLGFSSF